MKQIYNGDIKGLTALVDGINSKQKFQFFPTNEITHAKMKKDRLVVSGLFCKGIGQLSEHEDLIKIDLKVRLRRQFIFSGLFVLILLSGFIWGENVTINGNPDPTFWERIGFASIGFVLFIVIPRFILLQVRNDFQKKVENLFT